MSESSSTSDPLEALLRDVARAPDRATASERASPLAIGQRVSRFELVREIGRGGFGVVYEALDTELGRHVAVKAMRVERAGADALDLFRREAQAAACLNHPNIVALYDFGVSDDVPYLVLELVRGETVARRIRNGPLAITEAIGLAIQMARGLEHAHAAGVIHRDLKPANLLVTDDGRMKILDFGLARSLSGGTPAFMAPEQRRGEAGDARTDLYSFGLTLHVMITGELPTVEPTDALPPAVAALIARLVAPAPADRLASCSELLAELTALDFVPVAPLQSVLRRPRRQWPAAVAVLAALAGGALAWNAMTTQPEPAPAQTAPRVSPRSLPSGPEAARLYLEGIADHRAKRIAAARSHFERVVELEPAFAPAHRRLAELIRDRTRALAESKLAVEHAGGVGKVERLEIEAFHRGVLGELAQCADLYRALFELEPGDLHIGLATFYAEADANRLDAARTTLDRVRELPSLGDDEILLDFAEAHLADARGDYRSAQVAAARAGIKAKARGHKPILIDARDAEQWALYNLGEPLRARTAIEEMRALRIELGDHDGAVTTLGHLGTLAMERGELADARRMYDEVVAHFRPHGFDRFSMTLAFVVELEARRGRLAELDAALDELDAHGPNAVYRPAIAFHDMMLGRRLELRGDLAGARARFEAAERVYREFDDNRNLAGTLVALGRVLVVQGELVSGRSRLEEALTIRKTLGARRTIAEAQTALAELALAERKPEVAEALVTLAETEMARQGAVDAQALAGALRARAAAALGRSADATAILAPYLARRSESAEVRTRVAIASADPARLDEVIRDNQAAGLVTLEREARAARR